MAKPIRHSGKWRIRWINEKGERQSASFKNHQDAQFELRQREVEVEEIKRGFRERRIVDKTFSELCDYWVDKRVPLKRYGDADLSIIRCHLRPTFGKLLIRNIGVKEADEFQAQRAYLDKKTVANHLTLLISMLNVAIDLNWLIKVPRIKKPKVRIFSADYRYLKTTEEIKRFLNATLLEGEEVYMFYATAIFTGMRAGELAGLERGDIDLKRRLITVQRSFSGPTKGDEVRHLPILDPLLPLLQTWLVKNPTQLVFPNNAGNMHQPSARLFQEVLHRILERAGFTKPLHKGKERRYIRFHDLRHSFASHWVMNGGDIFKLQKILGHKSVIMTQRYSHLSPDIFAQDHSRMGFQLPHEKAKIIQFHK